MTESESGKKQYVISKITNEEPGLTKGKRYEVLNYGYWAGRVWALIVNDRGGNNNYRFHKIFGASENKVV